MLSAAAGRPPTGKVRTLMCTPSATEEMETEFGILEMVPPAGTNQGWKHLTIALKKNARGETQLWTTDTHVHIVTPLKDKQ